MTALDFYNAIKVKRSQSYRTCLKSRLISTSRLIPLLQLPWKSVTIFVGGLVLTINVRPNRIDHYSDVIMTSQITSLTNVYSTVYSCVDQRKHRSSASPAFVRGIHRLPVNSPHKGPYECLLNRLFMRRSKKTSKFRLTGLCEGNSPVTCEFPAQRANNVKNVSIWWRHHDISKRRLQRRN